MANQRGEQSGVQSKWEILGAQNDKISSNLVNTLTKNFRVGTSDAKDLARFISTMLEKSATESIVASWLAV